MTRSPISRTRLQVNKLSLWIEGSIRSETGLPRHRGNKRRRLRPSAGTSAYRDEILAWEQTKEHGRDERFVELGQYLCEVRAGQYWRLENLKSFDEFLEKRFPESRRIAYYLLTIHEHPNRVPKQQIREVGWTRARELVAHRDGTDFLVGAAVETDTSIESHEPPVSIGCAAAYGPRIVRAA